MILPYSNLQLKYHNPGANNPLVLPIHVICNTDDNALFSNIKENSRRPGGWIKSRPAHAGIAVLCGSGPSLSDYLTDIRQWRNHGATIFAMNGAASYLAANGILADYQVIIDAREQTSDLVGPAKEHLFASQVHPRCFERMPSAKIWHLQIEGIEDHFPEYEDEYCMIGGAASVGNTATCLAYALGYRELHIYGYDSSHRDGKGHAFSQPMNDGDPCALVTFCGKEYLASLTMKLQAEKFQETARILQGLGCAIKVYGDGLLPAMWNTPRERLTEQEKYERMWAIKAYRTLSPGEECIDAFINRISLGGRLSISGKSILDIGCGTGRAGLKMKAAGLDVTLMDFTENSRDYAAMVLPFIQHDITKTFPISANYGFCADVMEHIPPDDVPLVLANILSACKEVFFNISTVPDQLGAIINQELHLAVKPAEWWKHEIEMAGGCVAEYVAGNDGVSIVATSLH